MSLPSTVLLSPPPQPQLSPRTTAYSLYPATSSAGAVVPVVLPFTNTAATLFHGAFPPLSSISNSTVSPSATS